MALTAAEHQFKYPSLAGALRHVLGRDPTARQDFPSARIPTRHLAVTKGWGARGTPASGRAVLYESQICQRQDEAAVAAHGIPPPQKPRERSYRGTLCRRRRAAGNGSR